MQYAALVSFVLLTATGIDASATQGNTTTAAAKISKFSLWRIPECLPNLLFSAESGTELLIRKWWFNDSLFMPHLTFNVSTRMVKFIAPSVIGSLINPLVGPLVCPLIISPLIGIVLDALPVPGSPAESSIFSLFNIRKVISELRYLIEVGSEALRNVIRNPCLAGTEKPLSPRALVQRTEELGSKLGHVMTIFGEGLRKAIVSRYPLLCKLLPEFCRGIDKQDSED